MYHELRKRGTEGTAPERDADPAGAATLALRASRRAVRAPRLSPSGCRSRRAPEARTPSDRRRRQRHPHLIVLAALVGGIALAIGKQRFEAPGPLERERIVNIPRGLGIKDIAELLQREGVIDQPWVFMGRRHGAQGARRVEVRRIPVPSSGEPARRRRHPDRRQGDSAPGDHSGGTDVRADRRPAPRERHPLRHRSRRSPRKERCCRRPTASAAARRASRSLQRMQQAQKRAAPGAWERRSADLPIQTPEQLIVLASIIEKETGRADERSRVAAVFINRLKQKMKLQSDPDDHLRPGRRQGHARPADHAQRDRAADALQHLCDHRPAARADRQSGTRRARGRCQSVAHARDLLRRRRHRRPMRSPRPTSSISATSRGCARSSSSRRTSRRMPRHAGSRHAAPAAHPRCRHRALCAARQRAAAPAGPLRRRPLRQRRRRVRNRRS